jgi:hypothetical protein
MAKCERHLWDDRDKEPCWKCEELKYKKFNTMAKDKCVSCGIETAYDFETHIDLRTSYIEGVGQMCIACFNRGYKMTEENQDYKNFDANENLNNIKIIQNMIKETPNNYELGEKLRRLLD